MPLKNPAYFDKVVLANGGTLETEAGTAVVSISATGTPTVATSIETVVNLTTTGNTTIGDASSDTMTVNATPTFQTDVSIASGKKIAGVGTGANGIVLKNLKNATASTLSGTQKDIEIDIGGVAYYFTVYPTKA